MGLVPLAFFSQLPDLALDEFPLERCQVPQEQYPVQMIVLVEDRARQQTISFHFETPALRVTRPYNDPLGSCDVSLEPRDAEASFLADLFAFRLQDFWIDEHEFLLRIFSRRAVDHREPLQEADLGRCQSDAAGIVPIMGAYGNDFRPVIHGRSLFEEVNEGHDDWSRPIMIQNVPQQGIDNAYYEERGLRSEQFKIILRKYGVRPVRRPGELYDMKADPGETRNLWDSARSTVKEMALKVRDWGEEYDDDLSIDLGSWAMENA
jgi:hypothetical protein